MKLKKSEGRDMDTPSHMPEWIHIQENKNNSSLSFFSISSLQLFRTKSLKLPQFFLLLHFSWKNNLSFESSIHSVKSMFFHVVANL